MEILLWLVPAALATAVTALLAGRAARREEDERLRRLATRLEAEAAREADRRSLEELDGVSAVRPLSRPETPVADPEASSAPAVPAAGQQHGPERRTA